MENPNNMETKLNYFSRNLRFLRKSRNLSQKELSDLMDINIGSTTVSNYEKRITEPDIEAIIKISIFFEVSISDLLVKNMESQGIEYSTKVEEAISGYSVRTIEPKNDCEFELEQAKRQIAFLEQLYKDSIKQIIDRIKVE